MQTIEIRTTQNVVIEYELATLRERLLAYVLDALIFFVVYYLLFFLLMSTMLEVLSSWGDGIFTFLALVPIALWLVYHLLMEVFNNGQTTGKKILGIRVIKIDGNEPGIGDYLLRMVFQIVDALFSLGVVGSILIASSENHQRFGDMAAGTTVIRKGTSKSYRLRDILQLEQATDYQAQYPEAKRLSEQDVLLIKSVIDRYQSFGNEAHEEAMDVLAQRLQEILGLTKTPGDKVAFFKAVIRDYMVLTR
jgi:uncharacterized RDD family membrane protein YckC